MEKTISSYIEKNERLQLIKISEKDNPNWTFEVRANRVIIQRFNREQALFARLFFYHCVHEVLINRRASLLNMTF